MSGMAARGAHVGKRVEKGEQPSVFDVLSQESLTTSLKPALSHLLKFLATVNRDRWGVASRWSQEIFTVFDLLLQNYYLKNYGSSFSENFYGMKRVLLSTGLPPSRGIHRLKSLLAVVAWPYIRDSLERLHARLSELLQFSQPRKSDPLRLRLSRLFVRIWPWLKTILSAISFILQLGYATSFSQSHSLLLLFCGVRLEKLTPEDISAFSSVPVHLQEGLVLTRLWRLLVSFPGLCSRLFGYALFFVQFLDVLYNSDMGSQLTGASGMGGKVMKAPHKMLKESDVFCLEVSKCPLCLHRRVNDTALSVSGYVFCFSCIDNFIRQEGRCPLTGLPASPANLVRLYITAAAF